MFYIIKSGSVRFFDKGITTTKNAKNTLAHITKVEGEWFGTEAFVCGAYSSMTHMDLLDRSLRGDASVGNGFSAVADKGGVEVVCG